MIRINNGPMVYQNGCQDYRDYYRNGNFYFNNIFCFIIYIITVSLGYVDRFKF